MKINKYTEQSGLMPREEWTKLIEINTSLLKACKEFVKAKTEAENDECYSMNCGYHQIAIDKVTEGIKEAIKQTESK